MKKLTATILASLMLFAVPAYASQGEVNDKSVGKLYADYITAQPDKFMGEDRGIIITDLTGDSQPEVIAYSITGEEYTHVIDRVLYIDNGLVKETNSVYENSVFAGVLPEKNASTAAGIFQYANSYTYVNFDSEQKLNLNMVDGRYILTAADDMRKMVGDKSYDDIYYKKYRRLNIPVANLKGVLSADDIKSIVSYYEAELLKKLDIRTSDWAAEEISRAEELGLIPPSLMDKDLTISTTREEFAAIAVTLYKKISEDMLEAKETVFRDIENSPYKTEIELATALEITTGTSLEEGKEAFSPNDLIQRQELATMLCRLYKKHTYKDWSLKNDANFNIMPNVTKLYKDDEHIADYAKEAVYFMADKGVVEGLMEDFFEPVFKSITHGGLATREQAVVMALRAYENLFDK